MQPSGVSIDPVSLRPKRQGIVVGEREQAMREEKALRDKAADINLVHDEAGQRITTLIWGLLEKRIEVLVKEDEKAEAYVELLNELGHRYNIARQAVDKLYRRNFE